MSKFNKPSTGTKTVNLAGGESYAISPKLELATVMLTSFLKDQFYRSADETLTKIKGLIAQIPDKKFVAQCAVYARTEFGMRSISHAVAGEIAKHVKGEEWTKDFFASVIYRPDDATEILAYYLSQYNKPIPNSLKKGLALGLSKFSEYQISKYRAENSTVKMVDILNLVHPQPNEKTGKAFTKLIKGELINVDRWETKLTQIGQTVKDESEKLSMKAEVWTSMLTKKQLPYFALLRNLRNIMEQAPEALPLALGQLVNPKSIQESLVLPFRYTTAMKEFQSHENPMARLVVSVISKAIDIALENVPKMDGRTLVALDVSGSMEGKPAEIGSLFASVLCKAWNADLLTFDTSARFVQYNGADSVSTIAAQIPFTGGGTDFHSIFQTLTRPYDRIVLLSDMQGWAGYNAPTSSFHEWEMRTASLPFVYSFDLQGYGTLQMPSNRVACLAGFSEKIFDIMKFLEEDKNALIHRIESVTLPYNAKKTPEPSFA